MGKKKTKKNTLLWSVIISTPGPLAVGIGLITGRSSTQMADFIRRSAELLALFVAFFVYKATNKTGDYDRHKKHKLEKESNIFSGSMMCLGGLIMLILAILNDGAERGQGFELFPGICVSTFGAITNIIFWIKYKNLSKSEPNAIFNTQVRLYSSKTMVDSGVALTLLLLLAFPGAFFTHIIDFVGSILVACYVVFCGVNTIRINLLSKLPE